MSKEKMTVAQFHIIRFIIVIVTALIIAAAFTGVGLYAGKLLGLKTPILAFVGVIVSFPVTQLVLFKLMRYMGKRFLAR